MSQPEVISHPSAGTSQLEAVPSEERESRTRTLHDEMLASVGRTAYVRDEVYIPLVSADKLRGVNARVTREFGTEARRLKIVGPDVVAFGEATVYRLPNEHTAEVLGALVIERRLARRSHYLRYPILSDVTRDDARANAFSKSIRQLEGLIVDTEGRSAITREGTKSRTVYGLSDVVVDDIRHTLSYKDARFHHAREAFMHYILNGGQLPSMREAESMRASKIALSETAGKGLSPGQEDRFKLLSEQRAALVAHRSDVASPEAAAHELARREQGFLQRNVRHEFSPEWQARAACRDPYTARLFFPVSGEVRADRESREARAKAICRSCPVIAQCLQQALANKEDYGIWAGLNEEELRKRRNG